jgi:hypothetical protein
VLATVLSVAQAAPVADTAPAKVQPASEEACKAACGAVVARCTAVFGAAMGDMRPFCEQAVLRRCRAMGVRVCAPETAPAD